MDKKIILFAAGALAMAACSSNDPEVQAGGADEIRLYTEVVAQTRADDDPVALQDAQFAEETDISVMIVDKAEENQVNYSLETYRATGNGGLTAMNKQYFPPSGSNVDVFAFHPVGATSTFTVASDQRATGDYRVSDLMFAKLTDINKDTPPIKRVLHFEHLCSKLIVKLVKGNGVTDAEMGAAKITLGKVTDVLSNLVMGGRFDANTGKFDSDPNVTGSLLIATDAGTLPHAVVVVPQHMSGKKLTVELGGGKKSYELPEGTEFEGGKKYTYTVTVNKAELVVTVDITPWTTPDGWEDPEPKIKV